MTATRRSSLAPSTRPQERAGRTAPAAASADVLRNVRREVLMGRWATVRKDVRATSSNRIPRDSMRMRGDVPLGNQPDKFAQPDLVLRDDPGCRCDQLEACWAIAQSPAGAASDRMETPVIPSCSNAAT